MEEVNKGAFVCVWTDEIGDDTKDGALKAAMLNLKSSTNSEIFFMIIPSRAPIEDFKAIFDDIGLVMDLRNDPNVISKMIQMMINTVICN